VNNVDVEQFRWSLDQYGAQLQAWPDPESAEKLLLESVEARTLLATVVAIEQALQEGSHVAPEALKQRIMAQISEPRTSIRQEIATLLPLQGRWTRAATAALPLLLGFAFGFTSQESGSATDNDVDSLWIVGDGLEQINIEIDSSGTRIEEE
jgi:hypothetical protein